MALERRRPRATGRKELTALGLRPGCGEEALRGQEGHRRPGAGLQLPRRRIVDRLAGEQIADRIGPEDRHRDELHQARVDLRHRHRRRIGAHRLRERRQSGQLRIRVDVAARRRQQAAVLVGDPEQVGADALAVVDRHRRQRVRVVGRDGALEREVAGEQRRLADQPLGALGHQGAEHVAGGGELALETALDPCADRRADHPQRRQQDGEDQHRERQEDLRPQATPRPPPPHS